MANEEKINGWVVREPVLGHYLTFSVKNLLELKVIIGLMKMENVVLH